MQDATYTQTQLKKKLNLLSLHDIHQMKLLILYKKIIDKQTPQNIQKMLETITSSQTPRNPRTKHYKSSPRFELPEYLQTAPNELIKAAKEMKIASFKRQIKKYIIERYSSLCTKLGCNACHMHIQIN